MNCTYNLTNSQLEGELIKILVGQTLYTNIYEIKRELVYWHSNINEIGLTKRVTNKLKRMEKQELVISEKLHGILYWKVYK